MGSNNVNKKSRRVTGSFLSIPHDVLSSKAYQFLSPSAVKLLVDIGCQFNGKNNGDLAACMSVLSGKGWRSTATLHRAKRELLRAGLIEQTRQGGMNMGPNLFAVTWRPVDACEDKQGRSRHSATPTKTASRLWRQPREAA